MQVPAILCARSMGLKVIVVDPLPGSPGLALADEAYVFDLADVESVLRIARDSHVSGIVTLGADYPMPTLAEVCARLSLPGPSMETMHAATNKHRMRECFAAAGISGPRSIVCRDLAAAVEAHHSLSMDTIFKPTISHGGRGVTKVAASADIQSITAAYDRAQAETRGGGILAEEFIDGPEFSVEMVTYKGKTSIVAVTDKLTSGAPHFVELGHSQPSRFPSLDLDALRQTAELGAKALGMENCAGHAEIRLGQNGPFVMEIAARLGGGYIASDLVPRSTGIDLVKAMIRVALGDAPDLTEQGERGVAIRFLGSTAGGRVVSVGGREQARETPGCFSAEIYVSPGHLVPPLRDSRGRIAHVICDGKDANEAVLRAQYALQCLSIVVEQNRPLHEAAKGEKR